MIEQIKQALEKATPGKWEVNDFDMMYSAEITSEHPKGVFNGIASGMYVPNAHLIANAPEWLRFLVGEVERKNEQYAELKKLFDINQQIGNANYQAAKELRKALEWYADGKNYRHVETPAYSDVVLDEGDYARQALQSMKGESL